MDILHGYYTKTQHVVVPQSLVEMKESENISTNFSYPIISKPTGLSCPLNGYLTLA